MLPRLSRRQTPRPPNWFHAYRMRPALEHIFHFNPLADFIRIHGKGSSLEFWRAGDDCRIARKAEAFFGQKDRHVHFAIGIFVVDQRDGIGAFGQALKADIFRIARRYLGAIAFGVFAAVGEKFRVGGHADKDIALHAAQAMHIHIQCGGRCGGVKRCSGEKGCCPNPQDRDRCRTFCPKT